MSQNTFRDMGKWTRNQIDMVVQSHDAKNFGVMTPETINSELERSIQQIYNIVEQLPVDTPVTIREAAISEARMAIELITGRSVQFVARSTGGRSGQRKLPGTN